MNHLEKTHIRVQSYVRKKKTNKAFKPVENKANYAVQAVYAREISKLFLVLAESWERKAK